jgi:phage terminase large subunit-like protein
VTEFWLIKYYNEIQNGNILVGRNLRSQLDNLIADMNDSRFVYDTREANFRMQFIERFCKHTKAPFHGKPFLLELWQKALIEALYSFRWTANGYQEFYDELMPKPNLRRFKKLMLIIGRKNGKSTLTASLALTELMVGEPGTDICCSSNDDAQSKIVFDEINSMRERFDSTDKRTFKNLKGIWNRKNKSTVFRLSDRTRNKEGRNIGLGILDESNEMQDNTIAKSIDQSMSTKFEPLFINITTEGFLRNGYLDDELKYAHSVLDGDVDDPTLLAWLYTQDSEAEIWQNERSWQKSNPSLGTIKRRKYIVDQLRKAQLDKAERIFMLAKDFNIKQNTSTAWLVESEYLNDEMFDIVDFRGAVGIGGIDLSETTDLCCAKALLMRPGDRIKYFLTKYFIPESKVEQGSREDKQNYLEWAKQGLIEISPGNENNHSLITEWYVNLYKQYGIRMYKIGYDAWGSKYLVRELEDVGFDTEKVPMDWSLSNPMKLLEADLKSGLVNYGANPIDKWCLGNVGLKLDSLGRIMPVKVNDQANRRIDGAVTKIIAYAVYQRNQTEYLNIVGR